MDKAVDVNMQDTDFKICLFVFERQILHRAGEEIFLLLVHSPGHHKCQNGVYHRKPASSSQSHMGAGVCTPRPEGN